MENRKAHKLILKPRFYSSNCYGFLIYIYVLVFEVSNGFNESHVASRKSDDFLGRALELGHHGHWRAFLHVKALGIEVLLQLGQTIHVAITSLLGRSHFITG